MNQPDPTTARLLAASRKLFAEQGFDGASVRAITRLARANLGAVTYHFGSKQRLYHAVLDQVFGTLVERVTAAASAGEAEGRATPRERLAAVVHAFFGFFAQYPEAPRLMIRHLAATGAPPAAALRHLRRVLQAVTALVRAGQERGELREVDPLLAVFTLVSQTVWFALARYTMATVSGVPLDEPERAEAVERHIADVVWRTLAPAGVAP